jgi:hypothetical protein
MAHMTEKYLLVLEELMVESQMEKLALNESLLRSDPKIVQLCNETIANFGKISVFYLMRKLKCSRLRAEEIFNAYMRET